jgi:hypothetical protein
VRPSLRRSVALVPVIALVLAPGALAAKPKPKPKPKPLPPSKALVITDRAGDANGVNSQSHLAPADPSQAGPGQRTAADILEVTFSRLDDRFTVLGLVATMKLSAAPDQGTIYRIQASAGECTQFWISYGVPVGGSPSASLRENCTGTVTTSPIDATVKDAVITFTLPFSKMPKSIKVGTPVFEAFGETKGHATTPAASPTVPTIDDTVIAAESYVIGS